MSKIGQEVIAGLHDFTERLKRGDLKGLRITTMRRIDPTKPISPKNVEVIKRT